MLLFLLFHECEKLLYRVFRRTFTTWLTNTHIHNNMLHFSFLFFYVEKSREREKERTIEEVPQESQINPIRAERSFLKVCGVLMFWMFEML